MKYQVRISDQALLDVDATLQWLCDQHAERAAAQWHARLMKQIDTLENHPERCSLAHESSLVSSEIRELLFGRRTGTYRILFEISGKVVYILRVRHAARDYLTRDDLE